MARTWGTTSWVVPAALGIGLLLACDGAAQSKKDRRKATMNEKNLTPILQAVIDAPALQPYLHPDQPGRTPLVVVAPNPDGLDLRKFGQPVVVKGKPVADKAFLEFTRIEETSGGYVVEFRYAIEGLSGRFDLRREGEGWVVDKHELNES